MSLTGATPGGRWEIHRGLPVRAIVKELMANDGNAAAGKPFFPSRLRDLWQDLEDLHRLGILVRDINPGNYIGGKLIDFKLDAYYADLGDDDADGIYGVDPTVYDWRRWEDDLEQVDAFLEHELYAAPETEATVE
ncbi:hypothetical protein VTI28DRAFT_8095 [Corynascus sepedonium]